MNLNDLKTTKEQQIFLQFLKGDYSTHLKSLTFETIEEAETVFYKMNYEKNLSELPIDISLNELYDNETKQTTTYVIELEKRNFSPMIESVINKYRSEYKPKGNGLFYEKIEVERIIALSKSKKLHIGTTETEYDLIIKSIKEREEVEAFCKPLIEKAMG